MIRRVHHTSFTVSDLERSLAFYRDLLGMEVIGEGVETAQHLASLGLLGCELAQGFHLSAPLTAEAAAHLLGPRRAAEPSPATPLRPVT